MVRTAALFTVALASTGATPTEVDRIREEMAKMNKQNKMQKAPVVRRMRTGSAGSWPAAGPWLITGGEAATTTYLSSRAETKC